MTTCIAVDRLVRCSCTLKFTDPSSCHCNEPGLVAWMICKESTSTPSHVDEATVGVSLRVVLLLVMLVLYRVKHVLVLDEDHWCINCR